MSHLDALIASTNADIAAHDAHFSATLQDTLDGCVNGELGPVSGDQIRAHTHSMGWYSIWPFGRSEEVVAPKALAGRHAVVVGYVHTGFEAGAL